MDETPDFPFRYPSLGPVDEGEGEVENPLETDPGIPLVIDPPCPFRI